jgi:hypothetical protein
LFAAVFAAGSDATFSGAFAAGCAVSAKTWLELQANMPKERRYPNCTIFDFVLILSVVITLL